MTDNFLPTGLAEIAEPLPGLNVETDLCSGQLLYNGAHVTQWDPKGIEHPILWMSEKSAFTPGEAIRGGVPVIFPWFGAGRSGNEQPGHGYARLAKWRLTEAITTERGAARVRLELANLQGLPGTDRYPNDAKIELHVSFGSVLQMTMVVTAGAEPIEFEQGMHTYFSVSDIKNVKVTGLDGASYEDRVAGEKLTQSGDVTFTGETDRLYDSRTNPVVVDEQWGRKIHIEKAGSAQTVVWNPWIDKSARMPDFGDDEWPGMVCVETVNCGNQAIRLAPGEKHVMSQVISVEK